MSKRAEHIDPDARVCGNCQHFDEDRDSESKLDGEVGGECYEAPPQVVIIEDEPWSFRPFVLATDRGCGRFQRKVSA